MRVWQDEIFERSPDTLHKINSLYNRANKHRKGKGVKKRELKLEEYAIFAASVDLGHGRNDVIGQFYADLDAVKKYQAKQLK